jgi:tetratricopeptide (TPR) repeat protein
MWRRFQKWARWTLDSYRRDLGRMFRGLGGMFRSGRRSVARALTFRSGAKQAPAVSTTARPPKSRPAVFRRFRNWTRFTLRYYGRLLSGAVAGVGSAWKRTWKQLTKPRPAPVVAPVTTPARPAEKPLKRIARFFRRLPRSIYFWTKSALLLNGRLLLTMGKGFRSWLRHGEGYSLIRGLPALLACCAVLWALLMPYFARYSRTLHYAAKLSSAIRMGELEEAELCAERLVRDTKGTPFYLFAYASILYERGEHARALAIMNSMAPADAPGYGLSQLWMVRRMMVQKQSSADAAKELERRLLWATRDDESAQGAQALLVRYYSSMGKPDAAEAFLHSGGSDAGSQLNVAMSYALKGDSEKAKSYAASARESLAAATKSQPDNAQIRLAWAQAAALEGDFNSAIEILEEGYRVTHAQAYRTTLSRLFFAWSCNLMHIRARLADRIVLLARSIDYDDSNPLLMRTLVDLAPITQPDAKAVREDLDKRIEAGNSPVVLQVYLAVDNFLSKDVAEANHRFELLRKNLPQSSIFLNNVAWTLVNTNPNNPALALDLIDKAIAQSPKEERFLGTRGEILFKLNRDQEALADLRKAEKVYPNNQEVKDAIERVLSRLQKPEVGQKNPPATKN